MADDSMFFIPNSNHKINNIVEHSNKTEYHQRCLCKLKIIDELLSLEDDLMVF